MKKKTLFTWLKQHKEIVALFILPLLITALVGLFYFLPTAFAKPSYDFVYAKCVKLTCEPSTREIYVENGKIKVPATYLDYNQDYPITIDTPGADFTDSIYSTSSDSPDLYIYHLATGLSEKLDSYDLTDLVVDEDEVSPDGFRLQRGSSNYNSFSGYDYSDYSNYYLVKGAKKVKLNISTDDYYYNNPNFIGWVLQR